MKAPDYAEPIIAWRAWLVVAEEEGIRLSSVVYRNVWPPRCASCAYPQRIYLPAHGESDDAPVEPGQLVAALAGYGVPVELIDCDLTDGDVVVSALGMRAAAR